MKRKFKVSFVIEVETGQWRDEINQACEGAKCGDVKDYVKDAVRSWGGSFYPTNPFFGLRETDITKVKVYNV